MILKILQSVQEMLKKPTNKTKIECSRILLAQVIEHLEASQNTHVPATTLSEIKGTYPPDSDGLSSEAQAARNELID